MGRTGERGKEGEHKVRPYTRIMLGAPRPAPGLCLAVSLPHLVRRAGPHPRRPRHPPGLYDAALDDIGESGAGPPPRVRCSTGLALAVAALGSLARDALGGGSGDTGNPRGRPARPAGRPAVRRVPAVRGRACTRRFHPSVRSRSPIPSPPSLLWTLAAGHRRRRGFHYSPGVWRALLGMTLGPQIFGHTLLNWSLRHYPSSTVAFAILLEPILDRRDGLVAAPPRPSPPSRCSAACSSWSPSPSSSGSRQRRSGWKTRRWGRAACGII